MSSIRDFIPMQRIGQGSYSTVYKVRRVSDQKIYALKKVKLGQLSMKEKENALNQIRILASIDSTQIIAYKQAFFDDTINVLCIVMEFADGGDLHEMVNQAKSTKKPFTQNQIWKAAGCLLKALVALHSRGIMHRDLKSANVFRTTQGYKLGDLNVSKVAGQGLAHTQTGTPYYASPQVWRDEPYDYRCDIWSLGCIIFQMATFTLPFTGRDMEQLFKNVQNCPTPPISSTYSSILTKFIGLCLLKNPKHRPTAKELLDNSSFKALLSNPTKKSQINAKLLNTIKLPFDLSQLKQKLPKSKYQSEISIPQISESLNQLDKYKSFKKQSLSSPILEQKVNKSAVYNKVNEQSRQSSREKYGNKSELLLSEKKSSENNLRHMMSPTTRIKGKQDIQSLREISRQVTSDIRMNEESGTKRHPVSEMKINPKLSEIGKNSDRVYLSSRKSNKVESSIRRYQKQDYLQNPIMLLDLIKRPQYSYINAESKIYSPIGIQKGSYLRQNKGIPKMQRPRVQLKKVRVGSSGSARPRGWWG